MKTPLSRRSFLKTSALATTAGLTIPAWSKAGATEVTAATVAAGAIAGTLEGSSTQTASGRSIASGPFDPTWESLARRYKVPEWYRDAKFGIWAHWTAQCVPEQGDWYGRNMYIQGHPQYEYHVKTYGHPSKVGLMEIQHRWKADKWNPEKLMALYKRAGAKIFFALANHHDNFDAYDSQYHAWNSLNVGPKKDIVGNWAKAARAQGLRFGVSNHGSWAPRWLQTAYGYDGEGPLAGVRYDAYYHNKHAGQGQWWEGLDPQDLYSGRSVVIPDGIKGALAVAEWHKKNTSLDRTNPLPDARFVENWFLRCQDLVDKYQPDVTYFDTNELPLEQAGLDLVAHYYNRSAARHGGRAEVVVNGKHMRPEHTGAFVDDIERGVTGGIRDEPWQIDTCIGHWHYDRALAEMNGYKTVEQVVSMLVDVVSKNGNLMLSIPLRGDGTIDEHEEAFLEGMAAWIAVHGEGIYSTRPWKVFGEGPTKLSGREQIATYTPEDIRFTTRGDSLYGFMLKWPTAGQALVKSLASGSVSLAGRKITDVTLLGHVGKLTWSQTEQGLKVKLPSQAPSVYATALHIKTTMA